MADERFHFATAAHHGTVLLTRDQRALAVYERVGADARWIAA